MKPAMNPASDILQIFIDKHVSWQRGLNVTQEGNAFL